MQENINYPKSKFILMIEVVEYEDGKHYVHHEINENDSTMKEIGLALYKMKQIEQEIIDREWDEGGEGYEIIDEGDL